MGHSEPRREQAWTSRQASARRERQNRWGCPRIVWLVLAAALICGESRSQGVFSDSQVKDYHSWLGKVEQELRALADDPLPSAEWAERLRHLPSSLPEEDGGTTAGQTAPPWRTAWLTEGVASILLLQVSESTQRRSELLQLADQTARLRRMISVSPTPEREAPEQEDEVALAQLERILAGPEYQPPPLEEPGLPRRLWEAIRLRLTRLLDDLLGEDWRGRAASEGVGGNAPAAPSSFSLPRWLIGLGVGVALLLSSRWLRSTRRGWKGLPRSHTESGTREVLGEILADGVTPDHLLAQAEALAGEEDFRSAIRLTYLATLLHLADLGVIPLHPAISNRDYVQAVRDEEELVSHFAHLTTRYEEAWYGNLPTRQDEYDDCRQTYTALAAAADLRPREPRL
jgi:hypothetical protein